MYVSLKLQNNHSSNLSKMVVMSFAISAVCISDLKQVFACKGTIYVKISNVYK